MCEVGTNLDIPLHVFGPETHMTAIVGMALGKREIPTAAAAADTTTANFLLPSSVSRNVCACFGNGFLISDFCLCKFVMLVKGSFV